MARATAVTKMGREKTLVWSMVRDVLSEHYSGEPPIWEGSVQGWGRFSADKPELLLPWSSMRKIGEKPKTARAYQFDGGVVFAQGKRIKVGVHCTIFEDAHFPRAASASLTTKEGTFWYYFYHMKEYPSHRRHERRPLSVKRIMLEDPASPHLHKR